MLVETKILFRFRRQFIDSNSAELLSFLKKSELHQCKKSIRKQILSVFMFTRLLGNQVINGFALLQSLLHVNQQLYTVNHSLDLLYL